MYTQEDIDKIKICREAIDKHRAFNQARVEALTVAKSVDEAKILIESKLGVVTTISADSTLKSTTAIKDVLEEERTKSTLEMNAVLREQGFDDYPSFQKFNNEVCFETYKDCYPVEGKCDWCGESKWINQPCLTAPETLGAGFPMELGKNCKYELIVEGRWEVDDYVYVLFMARLQVKNPKYTEVVDGIMYPLSICPEGHGFYVVREKVKPLTFDVFWR